MRKKNLYMLGYDYDGWFIYGKHGFGILPATLEEAESSLKSFGRKRKQITIYKLVPIKKVRAK